MTLTETKHPARSRNGRHTDCSAAGGKEEENTPQKALGGCASAEHDTYPDGKLYRAAVHHHLLHLKVNI